MPHIYVLHFDSFIQVYDTYIDNFRVITVFIPLNTYRVFVLGVFRRLCSSYLWIYMLLQKVVTPLCCKTLEFISAV